MHLRKRWAFAGLAILTLALAACGRVDQGTDATLETMITNGQVDDQNLYPFVGLMIAQGWAENANGELVYGPLWRCSGTLISKDLFLTAGHCVEDPADHVEIWFDWNVEGGITPDPNDVNPNGYPWTGQASGEPVAHPRYDPNAFFLYDLGMVVLDAPFEMGAYGEVPSLDQLDALKPGKRSRFTSVGYGLQRINPVFVEDERVRMFATPHLLQINTPGFTGDFSLLLSNNHSTGGTCFGDSGGPNFLGDSHVIAGVTSFGINGNCAGTGGVYRIDGEDDLAFINSFLSPE